MFDQNRVFLKWLQLRMAPMSFCFSFNQGGGAGWQLDTGEGGTQPERRVVYERGCVAVGRRSGGRAIDPSMLSQQLFLGTVLTLSD